MRVKCVMCETIETLPMNSPVAKKLRNRPIHTFMCDACQARIEEKTNARLATGNFIFYKSSHPAEKSF